MEETATVIQVRDRTALVSTEAKGACHSCSARGICHLSSQKAMMEVEVWNRLGAAVGDRVVIRLSGRSTLTAAFLLYLVPLMGFLLGVYLGQSLTGRQVWAVIIVLACMVVTYGGIRILDRRIGRSAKMRPEIVKILVRAASRSGHDAGEAEGATSSNGGAPRNGIE
jgi:sigma-E factor negative regulatory protein RseC